MKKLSFLLLLVAAGCGNSTVTTQSGTAACVTAAACNIIPGGVVGCANAVALINDNSVAAAAKIGPSQVNCIAAAGSDCAAAKKCLANGATPATCSGVSASCAATTWQSCTTAAGSGGNQGTQLFDCASVGQACFTNGANTNCGFGTCSGGGSMCVTPDGTAGGNLVQTCQQGITERQDCGAIDASCNPSGIFGPHCRGNGPACSGNGSLRCDGTVLVSCSDGQESRQDCSKFGLGCFGKTGGGFDCLAGTECDPNQSPTCMGNTLQFCNKGKSQKFDCAGAGFSSCSPNNGGSCA
jgi:hypothetical protein